MKEIKQYQANNGSIWDSPEQALACDTLDAEVATVMSALRERPTDMDFANGVGYVQQDSTAIAKVRILLHEIANQDGILKSWFDHQKEKVGKTDADLYNGHLSWQRRMLDGGHAPLGEAYYRLCCIDFQGREWGQQYYAEHPEQGVATAL